MLRQIYTVCSLHVAIQHGYVDKPFVAYPGSKSSMNARSYGTAGTPERIIAAAQLCRVFDFVKRISKSRCNLLLSSGKIHTLSMSSGALKIKPSKKVVGL